MKMTLETMVSKMVTRREVRNMFREAFAKTWYCAQTNETHYPALWAGYGVPDEDCTTACPYNHRYEIAARAVLRELNEEFAGDDDDDGLPRLKLPPYAEIGTQRDAVDAIMETVARAVVSMAD